MPSSPSAVCRSVITSRSPSFAHTECRSHITHGDMATIPPARDHGDNDSQHNDYHHEDDKDNNHEHDRQPPMYEDDRSRMEKTAQTTVHV